MIKAPKVTSFRVEKLAANFVLLKWDDVGSNFFYFLEFRIITDPNNPPNNWEPLGFTADTFKWVTGIARNSFYQYRIRSAFQGFENSDWEITEIFRTFPENAYNIVKPIEFQLGSTYHYERFRRNNRQYVDFNNDSIQYSMMQDGFSFDPGIENISSYADSIIEDEEKHEIQGDVPAVCVSRGRVTVIELDGVLYALERFQPVVKVSNDRGQTWITYQAFNNRAGNPVASNGMAYQNGINTFILGYDRIFEGVSSEEIKFSNDTVRWSNNNFTFVNIDVSSEIGFPVEVFGELAKLPSEMQTRAEAFAASNEFLYVASRDKVRKINLSAPVFDQDEESATFGEQIFEPDVYTVTGNEYSVVKKMDWFNGALYALVTGRVKTDQGGNRYDHTSPVNIERSDEIGIYRYTEETEEFVRVFGETEEERDKIDHVWSDMSTNGNELFFDEYQWTLPTLDDESIVDGENITHASRDDKRNWYTTDKSRHLNSLRTIDGDVWYNGPYQYYAETKYSWMARSGNRVWKTNNNKALVVYSRRVYTFDIEETSESFNNGVATLFVDNISRQGFSKYCSGIVIHRNTGEVVGCYEFPFRVRDEFEIFWRPERTLLTAELAGQVRPEPPSFEQDTLIRDPLLSPFLNKMAPETYVRSDSLYTQFAENYLRFISEGKYGYYQNMFNAIKNKYPKEEDSIMWLWSEMYRRNIYLDDEKREEVIRFFETRKNDFYSSKGTEDSYKFLFKLLYNEDVDIEIESKNTFEYDIIVESGNISEDIVGTTIGTPTGIANVTYIERDYNPQGTLQWKVTIHNMYGKFIEGQTIDNSNGTFTGVIKRGIKGKQLSSDSREYLERGRSYYVMKIISQLPTSRYRDDVIRFVHPGGFGFLGITLITVLINSGISANHVETIIDKLKSLRFDAGVPLEYPEQIPDLDESGNIQFNNYREVIMTDNPLAGQEPPIPPNYDTENGELWGLPASERRRPFSPTFDASWVRWSNLLTLLSLRLKDNIGNPGDPEEPTQRKLDESDL